MWTHDPVAFSERGDVRRSAGLVSDRPLPGRKARSGIWGSGLGLWRRERGTARRGRGPGGGRPVRRHVGVRADRHRSSPPSAAWALSPSARCSARPSTPPGTPAGTAVPGRWGSSGGTTPARPATQVSGRGDPGSFGPLVEAMYQARHTAIDRMTAECAALGGHGVVGVRLSRGSFPLGGLEFTAIGTAVRAPGAARGPAGAFYLRCVRAGFRQADHGGLGTRRARARHLDRVAAR